MNPLKFFLLLILFILISPKNLNESELKTLKHQLQNDECHTRIIDNSKILSEEEYTFLCKVLKKYPSFILRIRNEMEYLIKGAVFYEASSMKFFEDNCKKYSYKNMCKYGFLIDIYVEAKVIIIQPGTNSSKLVDDSFRIRSIESVRPVLLNERWSDALYKILTLLIYKLNNGPLKYEGSSSNHPNNFLKYILIPVLVVGFLILTILLHFLSKGIINKDCFKYLDQLFDYWQAIVGQNMQEMLESKNKLHEPTETLLDKNQNKDEDEINTSIKKEEEKKKIQIKERICIFCWEETKNEDEYFLYCGHCYHEKCLRQWRLFYYKCCPCSFEAEQGDPNLKEKPDKVYLTIDDLKILLGLCFDAFRKDSLKDYFSVKAEKMKVIKKNIKEPEIEQKCWIGEGELYFYKKYRFFYKMYKAFKMSVFIIAFYPSFLKSKKVSLITQLVKTKQKNATVEHL